MNPPLAGGVFLPVGLRDASVITALAESPLRDPGQGGRFLHGEPLAGVRVEQLTDERGQVRYRGVLLLDELL